MEQNIFLLIPNLIGGFQKQYLFPISIISGYARIILVLVACYFMATDYKIASVTYFLSVFLDFIDGPVARMLQKYTKTFETLGCTQTSIF